MTRPRVALAIGLMFVAHTGNASEYRTVTWLADHPSELTGVLRICRDNAGLARHNPTCINADEAQYLVAQREMQRGGDVGSPFQPSYWLTHPVDRRQQVWACEMMDKQHAVIDPTTARICSAARAGG